MIGNLQVYRHPSGRTYSPGDARCLLHFYLSAMMTRLKVNATAFQKMIGKSLSTMP